MMKRGRWFFGVVRMWVSVCSIHFVPLPSWAHSRAAVVTARVVAPGTGVASPVARDDGASAGSPGPQDGRPRGDAAVRRRGALRAARARPAQPARRDRLLRRGHSRAPRRRSATSSASGCASTRSGRCTCWRSSPCSPTCAPGAASRRWSCATPGQLIEELAAEIESMERRPGLIRRQVEVRTPLRLPRAHLACAPACPPARDGARDGAPTTSWSLGARAGRPGPIRAQRRRCAAIRSSVSHPDCRAAASRSSSPSASRALYGGRCTRRAARRARAVITLALQAA